MLNPQVVPSWLAQEYAFFHQIVTAKGFPCYFASIAEKGGELRYAHIEGIELLCRFGGCRLLEREVIY